MVIDGLHTSPNKASNQVTKKAEKVTTENLQYDPEEVNYQTDKCHRIGPINTKDCTQSTIVQFKTHSFREAVYSKRIKCNKKQKIKLSITQRRRKTLTYAYSNADKLSEIDIFCVGLKNAVKNKFVYSFRDKGELLNLFEKFGWDLDNFDGELEGGSTVGNEQ